MSEPPDSPSSPRPQPVQPPVLGYQAMRSGATVRVASCGDAGEAQLILGELAAADIPGAVLDEHTSALGPWGGGAVIQVQVPEEDADSAAEVIARLRSGDGLEPEEGPPDGSADFTTDAAGRRTPLAVAGSYGTACAMYEAAAVLGSVRIAAFLPNLVRRRSGGEGDPPRRFLVRVCEEDLDRAQSVLEDARREAEEQAGREGEERCPRCGSWRVYTLGSFWRSLFAALMPRRGEANKECLTCRHRWTAGV